jgi:hypothetical protein
MAFEDHGRYLALADIGRLDWFVRTGALQIARQRQALPVVGDAMAKFRRDLKVFQGFEIHTRLIGWDSKWGFIEHRFVRNRRVVAFAGGANEQSSRGHRPDHRDSDRVRVVADRARWPSATGHIPGTSADLSAAA